MAKTPTTEKKTAAKKPATKKTAAKKASSNKVVDTLEAVEGAEPAAKKAPKAKKATAPKAPIDIRQTVMHGEMRITHGGEAESDSAVAGIMGLADGIHALGRVRITSAAHFGSTTTLHVVLPDHPLPYEQYPGLILAIDSLTNLVSFDHVVIGLVSSALIDDAAFSVLGAMKGDADNPAGASGRRTDWFEQAAIAAEDVAGRHVDA